MYVYHDLSTETHFILQNLILNEPAGNLGKIVLVSPFPPAHQDYAIILLNATDACGDVDCEGLG